MKAFMKAIDDKSWSVVAQGWTVLVVIDENGVLSNLSQDKWSENHHKEAMGNSKEINSIISNAAKEA